MLHACCWPVTGKTLREQAQILIKTHVFVLVHGAAMALYMFLPKNAAIIEVGHLDNSFVVHKSTYYMIFTGRQAFTCCRYNKVFAIEYAVNALPKSHSFPLQVHKHVT